MLFNFAFVTKFVPCLEHSKWKKCSYFVHRICVLQTALHYPYSGVLEAAVIWYKKFLFI